MCGAIFQPSFSAGRVGWQQRNITFEFQDHVIAHSIYFQDPDGHEIEITTYEI